MQKKAIRIVTQSHYRAPTATIFEKHKILKYQDIITQAKLTIMHSHFYEYGPIAFRDTWIKNANREMEYALRNSNNYIVPRPKIELFKKSPLYSFPVSWNVAGPSKYHSNFMTFRISLKDELLNVHNSLPNPYLLQALHHIHPPQPQPILIPPHPHPIQHHTPIITSPHRNMS